MLEVFAEILEENQKNSVQNPKDYFVNELLYCEKCRTPKQTRSELFGIIQKPYVPCQCEIEKEQKEKEAQQAWERSLKIAQIRSKCFVDQRLEEWTFANDSHQGDVSAMDSVHQYALNFAEMLKDGKGLLLYGA